MGTNPDMGEAMNTDLADMATLARLRTSPVTARYFTPDGRLVVVAGGADGDPAPDPAPDPTPDPAPAPDPAPDGDQDPTLLSEIAAMAKELGITPGQLKGRLDASKTWEKRAKKADEDAEAARLAGLDEAQRAIEEAEARGEAKGAAKSSTRLAAAELKAAGVPAEIVGDLDLSKFIDADGEVDTVKVAEVGGRYKALATPGPGSADGGPQGNPPPQQSIDDRIAAARADGNTELSISLNNQKLAALAAGS